MAEELELAKLEELSTQLYLNTNLDERSKAEKELLRFVNSADCLRKCQLLLERAHSCYSQLVAATTLMKLVTRTHQTLTIQQRLDIQNYVINYLATCPKLVDFVTIALTQLYAKIIKVGWFDTVKDEYVFQNVISQVHGFLQGSVPYCSIGVQMLSQVVCEINHCCETEANKPLSKQRKIASSFRDIQLYGIFTIALDLLRTQLQNWKNVGFKEEGEHNLMSLSVRLVYNCLIFDFIGTSPDESSDDIYTVQIPTNWRSSFLDFSMLDLFFDLYHCLPSPSSSTALLCLVQIASVRRTIFNNEERGKFLSHLTNGIKNILANPQKLSDAANYHEVCRLLARLKTNFQLGELVKVENYQETIALIAKFTVTSLQMWQFAPNSVHYLLNLWQKMVASVPYMKSTEPHLLETYTPEVTQAYITSRVEAVATVVREILEDPLDDIVSVQQQLDQLSVIGRCEYGKTCALLVQLFHQTAQAYQEFLNSSPSAVEELDIQIAIQEGRLTWLVYIIGAAIGGRVSFNITDEYDTMDGELICQVLQLMNLKDSHLPGRPCEKLELAILSFFEQFRKIYVGDTIQKNSKVYKRLSEVLGLNEEIMLLSVFIRKIITNLKYWSGSEQIVNKTLQLLNDLSIGYSCVRKLVKLEEIQFMLNNHNSDNFPFLSSNLPPSDMRYRTTFYTSLGRLLLIGLGEDEDKFEQFMLPLTASLESVGNAMKSAGNSVIYNLNAQNNLIGVARDLRGLAFAFNSKTSYMLLFEWLYPAYTPILQKAIELWYHTPIVTTPVLKLMAELVQNRSQRLQFDVSSPNGILLFREASKMIVNYGNQILTLTNLQKDEMYRMKLKGISICFSMLKSALCGGYVNFGVFSLYQDSALDDVLNTFVKMLLSIPQSDLLHYPKLSQTYYVLLECLAQDHMNFLSSLEPNLFYYILSSMSEGLNSVDTMVCSGCCAALDHLVTYLFKHISRKKRKAGAHLPKSDCCVKVLEHKPEIFQQMLSTNLHIVIFDECRNQWSMSRPLLGLILLNEEYFNQLRQGMINSQLPEKQAAISQSFDKLMDGIERNLITKNRERFTQNLGIFRREINESLKGTSTLNVASEMMSS